jgi:hypothetical protein
MDAGDIFVDEPKRFPGSFSPIIDTLWIYMHIDRINMQEGLDN